jgi:hypothetical protein
LTWAGLIEWQVINLLVSIQVGPQARFGADLAIEPSPTRNVSMASDLVK